MKSIETKPFCLTEIQSGSQLIQVIMQRIGEAINADIEFCTKNDPSQTHQVSFLRIAYKEFGDKQS